MIPNSIPNPHSLGEKEWVLVICIACLDCPETVTLICPMIEILSFSDGAIIDKNHNG